MYIERSMETLGVFLFLSMVQKVRATDNCIGKGPSDDEFTKWEPSWGRLGRQGCQVRGNAVGQPREYQFHGGSCSASVFDTPVLGAVSEPALID